MAKKKPARHSAVKKSGKRTVKRSGPQTKTAQPKTVRKKPPAMKVAVRVTREPVKSAKPRAKSASSRPDSPADLQQTSSADLPAAIPKVLESQCQADTQDSVAACPPRYARPISHDEIRHRAYLKWEAAGRPPGDGGHFWAEAERELSQQS